MCLGPDVPQGAPCFHVVRYSSVGAGDAAEDRCATFLSMRCIVVCLDTDWEQYGAAEREQPRQWGNT